MDLIRKIRKLVEEGEYSATNHFIEEMDKDGLSTAQVEDIVLKGTVAKRDRQRNRITFKYNDLMCCIEIEKKGNNCEVIMITTGRKRG